MYININILNRTSSTDTDDDIFPTSSKINQEPKYQYNVWKHKRC